MTALEATLKHMIALDGPMPIAQFMALALGHPAHGYYTSGRDPFGARGDFITAPEISQMFGELIGLWAAAVWELVGRPAPVRLVELGPGRGTLMADALRAIKVAAPFQAALELALVEISLPLRQRQAAALAASGVRASWYQGLAEVPEGPLIAIANEFFDSLPIHQAVRAADGWHERMVGLDGSGELTLAVHPEPIAGFAIMLPPELREAPIGAIFEWRSAELIVELAKRVVVHGGAALIIDYGHRQSRLGASMQAVRRQRFVSVLHRPGEVDLTAHVDFAALGRAAAAVGAQIFGPVPMGHFLDRLGIYARAARLKNAAPHAGPEIDRAVRRLTGAGQGAMGALFQVMAIAGPGSLELPGFEGSADKLATAEESVPQQAPAR